ALTMAMSIVISGVVALTLTPVLCAMTLKPHAKNEQPRGLISFVNRFIKMVARRRANAVRFVLAILLGLGAGYGIYSLLHVEVIHELASEQIHLTPHGVPELWNSPEKIIGCVMAVLFFFTFRSMLSGSEPGEEKVRGPLGIFLHWFNRGVDLVTGGFVAIVSRIITRRLMTMLVIGCFGYGILVVNKVLTSGFIPLVG